eukprot:1994752-Karenia_brevis.AAC.2
MPNANTRRRRREARCAAERRDLSDGGVEERRRGNGHASTDEGASRAPVQAGEGAVRPSAASHGGMAAAAADAKAWPVLSKPAAAVSHYTAKGHKAGSAGNACSSHATMESISAMVKDKGEGGAPKEEAEEKPFCPREEGGEEGAEEALSKDQVVIPFLEMDVNAIVDEIFDIEAEYDALDILNKTPPAKSGPKTWSSPIWCPQMVSLPTLPKVPEFDFDKMENGKKEIAGSLSEKPSACDVACVPGSSSEKPSAWDAKLTKTPTSAKPSAWDEYDDAG